MSCSLPKTAFSICMVVAIAGPVIADDVRDHDERGVHSDAPPSSPPTEVPAAPERDGTRNWEAIGVSSSLIFGSDRRSHPREARVVMFCAWRPLCAAGLGVYYCK
jgi:hypothetical protein